MGELYKLQRRQPLDNLNREGSKGHSRVCYKLKKHCTKAGGMSVCDGFRTSR